MKWPNIVNRHCSTSFTILSYTFSNYCTFFFSLFPAKLLCQSHHNRIRKENRHLFKAANWCQRRNHIRLQVPFGRRKDSVFVWTHRVSWYTQLNLKHDFVNIYINKNNINNTC
jgi:hypothetical protein